MLGFTVNVVGAGELQLLAGVASRYGVWLGCSVLMWVPYCMVRGLRSRTATHMVRYTYAYKNNYMYAALLMHIY